MQTSSKQHPAMSVRMSMGIMLFIAAIIYYALFPGYLFIFQVLFVISLFVIGIDINKPVFGLFWPVLGGVFLSSVYSVNRIESVPIWATYAVIFIFSSLVPRQKKDYLIQGFVLATGIIGCISAVSVICMALGISLPVPLSLLQSNEDLLIPHFGHALYAIFLLVAYPYAFGRATLGRINRKWVAITVYFAICIILTLSKGVWIVASGQSILLLWKYRRTPFRPFLLGAITVLALSLIAYLWMGTGSRLTGKLVKPSVASRVEYWKQGMRVISTSSPLRLFIGHGPGTFYEFSNSFQSEPDYWSRSAHNVILQFLVENGLFITAFLFLAIMVLFFKNGYSYSFVTWVILIGIIGYSLFGTADMGMAPVLFLFLLLIQESEQGKAMRVHYAMRNIVLFVVGIMWFLYGMLYLTYYLGDSSDRRFIGYFPYDRTAWMILIDRQTGSERALDDIRDQYREHAAFATDLDRMIIEKKNELHMSCGAFRDGMRFLRVVPFDRSALSITRENAQSCTDMRQQERNKLWIDLEPQYKEAYVYHRSVRQLMQTAAAESYRTGALNTYERWSTKLWSVSRTNNSNEWVGEMLDVPGTAFPAEKKWSIRVSAVNQGEPSGIVLNSGSNPEGQVWWRPTISLFFGIGEGGKRVYLDARDGTNENAHLLIDRVLTKAYSSYTLLFTDQGKVITIIAGDNYQIATININRRTNNAFPYGLFPDNRFFIGYGIAPHAKLRITSLRIH